MKIQTALIPHKHVRFAGSLVGMAGYVRQFIGNSSISVDSLWAKIEAENNEAFNLEFTHLIYSLDILRCIQEISIDANGLIKNSNAHRTKVLDVVRSNHEAD